LKIIELISRYENEARRLHSNCDAEQSGNLQWPPGCFFNLNLAIILIIREGKKQFQQPSYVDGHVKYVIM
jgi:hypothetical protein